jgi:hypothetical protein
MSQYISTDDVLTSELQQYNHYICNSGRDIAMFTSKFGSLEFRLASPADAEVDATDYREKLMLHALLVLV